MKIWKKTLALILGLTTFTSLTACGGDIDSSSSDDSSDVSYTSEEKTEISEQLMQSIAQQMLQAKTVTLTTTATFRPEATVWEEDGNKWSQNQLVNSSSANITLILSQTTNGTYNVKLTGTLASTYDGETETATVNAYLINGYVFTEDFETPNNYYSSPLIPEESMDSIEDVSLILQNAMEMVLEDVDLPTIDWKSLMDSITGFATETFSFTADSIKLEHDFAPAIQEMQSFIGEINPKQTIKAFLDANLAKIDASLSVDAILNEVESLANINARTALNQLDAWLTENYQTTLQGAWNSITASDKFVELFTYISSFTEMLPSEVSEMLTAMQKFDINAYLTSIDGFDTMTLYDVALAMMNPYEEEYPSVSELREMLSQYLQMKVEDFIPVEFFDIVEDIQVNTLSNAIEFGFDSSYSLTEFSNRFTADVSATVPSYREGLTDTYKVYADLQQAYTLSSVAFPIALPNGAIIYDD